jgi:replicative DNA helicase
MSQRTMLPHDERTEQAFLGALLIDPEAVHRVRTMVNTDDLYKVTHQYVYAAMLSLADRSEQVDFVTLANELDRRQDGRQSQLTAVGGAAFLTKLLNVTPTALNVESYAKSIQTYSVQRKIILAASKIAEMAYCGQDPADDEPLSADEMVACAERELLKATGTGHYDINVKTFASVLQEIISNQQDLANGQKITGIDPVLPSLRKALPFGVLQRGWMVGVGANPKAGKSLWMANVVAKALVDGHNICLVGTEMMAIENGYRLVPMLTYILKGVVPNITTPDLLRQVYGKDDIEGQRTKARVINDTGKLLLWASEHTKGNLLIIDEPLTVSALRSILVREQITWGPFDLIVVDHIGMMLPEGNPRTEVQAMNQISGDLLTLARSSLLGNPTLLFVSAFTKGENTDKPSMHRFRDTFMLAHNAHLLLGIYEGDDGGKLMHIAGMRSSNGQGDVADDIPIEIHKEYGVIFEKTRVDLGF